MQGKFDVIFICFDISCGVLCYTPLILFQVIDGVEASFAAWGEEYTVDCKKKDRGNHSKWLKRNLQHVKRVVKRTKSRLNCT